MRTVRSKTLANAMDQKTRSNRALGKQNREQLSEESRFHKSREIAENLMATAVWKQAKQVLLYASYGSEVSTGLLIDAALAAGKEVFLPKVLGDQMEFFRITDRAELAPGYQHILEPPGQTKRFLPDASIPTLLTAPGLAFDPAHALATERAFMTAILVKFLLPTDLILSGSAFPASCSRYWMGKNRMISTWI